MIRHRHFWVEILLILAAFGLFWLPVRDYRVLHTGTDSYETHHALWGEREKTQILSMSRPLVGAGALLVDLRRSGALTPVEVRLENLDMTVVAVGQIDASEVQDDVVAWAHFPAKVPAGEYRVVLGAPQATQDTAIGLRFDGQSKQLALGVVEQIPLWEKIYRWQLSHEQQARRLTWVAVGSILVTLTLMMAAWATRRWGARAWWMSLGLLFLTAIAIRLPTAVRVDSAFGGDAFNYLVKSQAWISGGDPFGADFRKAPAWTLLLLPGLTKWFDPLSWARAVNMVIAGGGVVLLALLMKRLKITDFFALGAGLLLAVQREWWWESVHTLANPLYTLLVLAAAYMFTYSVLKWGRYWLTVISGLAFLTRYEGGMLMALLVPVSWGLWSRRKKELVNGVVLILFFVGMPLLLWPLTGQIGVRTPGDVVADPGLYLVTSIDDFRQNMGRFELYIGRLWMLLPLVGEPLRWLIGGIFVGVLGAWWQKGRQIALLAGIPWIILWWLLYVSGWGGEQQFKELTAVLSGLVGIGVGAALFSRWRWSVPVFLMLVIHVVAITLIIPKTRYYLWLVPFVTAALMAGIVAIGFSYKSRAGRVGASLLIGAVVALVYFEANMAMSGALSEYNEKSHDHTVLVGAARSLRDMDGRVAVVDEAAVVLKGYLGDQRVVVASRETLNSEGSDRELIELLRKQDVEYVVETTVHPAWAVIEREPDFFDKVATFRTIHADTEAYIYRFVLEPVK